MGGVGLRSNNKSMLVFIGRQIYNKQEKKNRKASEMNDRYIAFDVETPNCYNNRMSAIGITAVEKGRITCNMSFLVNPEQRFDSFNIQFTGITPEMVASEPNFPTLWQKIEPIMSSGVLIAHNAPFDMAVLAKCLRDYGIDWKPYTQYACTCVMGRKCYPYLPNHRLNTMCQHLDIGLNHHDAGSDSNACAELLVDYMSRGLRVQDYLRRYDLKGCRTMRGDCKSPMRAKTI